MATGLPEDDAVNVWHYQAADDAHNTTNVISAWTAFVNTWQPFLPNTVAQNGHMIRLYKMADPEPRRPFVTYTFNLTSAPSTEAMPHEVALCLSYQALPESGEEQGSRRGRMYIGPLRVSEIGDGRPFLTTQQDLVDAFEAFVDDLTANSTEFLIYSRLHNSSVLPEQAWMDNAFDIQRRRGVAPTSRYTVSL